MPGFNLSMSRRRNLIPFMVVDILARKQIVGLKKNYPVFWEGKGKGIPQLEKNCKAEILKVQGKTSRK
jgi:hypothetical protein